MVEGAGWAKDEGSADGQRIEIRVKFDFPEGMLGMPELPRYFYFVTELPVFKLWGSKTLIFYFC